MTARDALAEGRLTEAVAIQTRTVLDAPTDDTARLFLFELHALKGDLPAARHHLQLVESDDPIWPDVARSFRRMLRAESRRSPDVYRPHFLLPPPSHLKRRWNATRAHRLGDPARATRWLDLADAATPEVRGFVDGREFVGLRDSDDRFAAQFEVFTGGRYVWVPFEQVRSLTLSPVEAVLDVAFRPAGLRLTDGRDVPVILPLRYPGSDAEGDEFALGETADWTSADAGLVCGLGAKVFTAGDEEFSLADCRMIEMRG